MEQVYENEACNYAPDLPAKKLANNKKTAKSRFFIVVIILLVICLLVSVTSLVCTFVLFNTSQKALEEKVTKMGQLPREELSTELKVDNSSQKALEARLAEIELTIAADKAELMRLKADNSQLRTALNETRQDWQASANNQQVLSESLQSLSDEVASYHLVEAEISCPPGYKRNPFANSCIRLVSVERTWASAKRDCESSEERLATFETLESQYWLFNLLRTSWQGSKVWVGGERFSTGVWRWRGETPGPIAIAVWGAEEPNNRGGNEPCLSTSVTEDVKFNDLSCGLPNKYICEINN